MINNVLDLLRSDGSIVVNKRLAKEIGLVEAVIYSELVSLFKYWSDRGELTDGEWFYCTFPNLEKNTTIPERTARRKINELEKLGLIESALKGLPAKKHYRITDKILEILGLVPAKVGQNGRTDNDNDSEGKVARSSDTYRSDKMAELDQTKWPTNNTKANNTDINNNHYIDNIDDDKRTEGSTAHNEEQINMIISNLKEATRDELTDRSFKAVVRKVVDKYNQGKIKGNFRDYLVTALVNKIEELELRRTKDKAKQNLSDSRKQLIEERLMNLKPNRDVPFYDWLEN